MPKLNKTIIRSIVRDLKSFEKICNELSKYVLNSEIRSWRYPPKMCHHIHINSILSEFKGSAYECYLLVLELIYDRFQYFLHLIIKYLDTIPLISQTFNLPRNVVSPECLSTGALLNMLWIRFQTLQRYILDFMIEKTGSSNGNNAQNVTLSLGAMLSQNISSPTVTYNQSNSFNRNTQTEACSFLKCESCYISEDLIKLIINEVQKQCVDCKIQSILSHRRDNMKEEIVHITQWGAMIKWSIAVRNDLQEIFQALTKQRNSNEKLQELLEEREYEIEGKHSKMDNEMHVLEDMVHTLQDQLQAEKSHASCLAQEKDILNLNLKNQAEEIQHLQHELRSSVNSLAEVTCTNSTLESELKKIANELEVLISSPKDYGYIVEKWRWFVTTWENERNNLRNKLHSLEIKFQENETTFKTELAKSEAIIKEEKEKQNKMSSELQKMNEYISECQHLRQQNEQHHFSLNQAEQKTMSLMKTMQSLEKELEQKKIQQQLLIENPDMNTKFEVKVYGNPEQDLENQIQANEIRICLLSEQTIKLKETLDKFRKLTKVHETAFSSKIK